VPLTLRLDPAGSPTTPGLDEGASRRVPPPSPSSSSRKAPSARRCPSCAQAFSGEARFFPFDGDALVDAPDWNPSADPLIGQVVDGRYEVASVIGEGGMGTVYEVRHATLGRRFALKVLRRDIADAEHSARFIQEAKAAAAIGHPNIVAVSDFGELSLGEAGRRTRVPYFVMEYLSGISLAQLLRAEKTLDPLRAGEIALQCAAGLSAAHAAGVVHRDLKPDNVFLTRNGDREFVKLLDFGVAKMAGTGRLTRAGMVFGTPHYMSPEQAAGQSVDHRADVYALGVILYECLAGRVPFEADTYMGVLTKHMFATPEPVDRMVPDASRLGALGPICMRCLAKSPHDRYPSMAEVVAAIEGALADAGIPRPGALRSERPQAGGPSRRPAPVVDEESISPPKLKPVVGPVGFGLGGLALVLLLLLGVREIRGSGSSPDKAAAASAVPPVSAATSPSTGETARPSQDGAPSGARPPATAAPASSSSAAAPVEAQTSAPAPAPPEGTKTHPVSVKPADKLPRGKTRPRGGDVVEPWK
jgi:serine/threonine protein kinase